MINFESYKNRKGLWFVLDKYLIFVNEKGEFEHLPETMILKDFSIKNVSSRKTERIDAKRYGTIKETFKAATRNLKSKKIGYKYGIIVYFKDMTCPYESTKSAVISIITKTEDGFSFSNDNYFHYNRQHQNERITKEHVEMMKCTTVPENWLVKYQVDSELSNLIKELQKKFYIHDVVFKRSESKKAKIEALQTIKTFLTVIQKVADISKLRKPTIVFKDIKKWSGTYNDYSNEISIDYLGVFFHEYFHHIDYATLIRRRDTKVDNLYDELVDGLIKDKTLTRFRQWKAPLLNQYGAVKNVNSKGGQHYIYWTAPHEILARYFADYMYYYFNNELPERHQNRHLDFEEEEVIRHKPKFDQFLKALFELEVNTEKEKGIFI